VSCGPCVWSVPACTHHRSGCATNRSLPTMLVMNQPPARGLGGQAHVDDGTTTDPRRVPAAVSGWGSPWNMEQSKEAMVGGSEALWESIDVGCEAKGRRMPWAGVCRGRSSPGGGPWAVKPGSTEGAKAKQQNRAYLCLRQSPIRHLN